MTSPVYKVVRANEIPGPDSKFRAIEEMLFGKMLEVRKLFEVELRRKFVAALQPHVPGVVDADLEGLAPRFLVTRTVGTSDKTVTFDGHFLFTFNDEVKLVVDGERHKLTIG
jgi:hypothetical protein